MLSPFLVAFYLAGICLLLHPARRWAPRLYWAASEAHLDALEAWLR